MSDLLSGTRVWLIRLPAHPLADAVTDDLLAELDADTRQRVLRYRSPERERTLVGHVALRRLLAPELGVASGEITLTRRCVNCGSIEHGKPSLAGVDGIEFSLSHSTDLVAIAIAAVPVGVDVELRSSATDWASIRLDTFGDEEWSNDPAALTDLWARKEAAVKATGQGLSVPLSGIRPVSNGDGSWRAGALRGWDLSSWDLGGGDLGLMTHSGAVAGGGGAPIVAELDLSL